MSSTITCGKSVAAIRSSSGRVLYALFEKTHCSNVYPHTPRWSVLTFGDVEHVFERIFQGAAYCEDGMLRSSNGKIKPENYIAAWLRELANPLELHEQSIDLSVSDRDASVWRIKEGDYNWQYHKPVVAGILPAAMIDRLEAGELVSLSLTEYADQVAALVETGSAIAWRLLSNTPSHDATNPALGYVTKPAKVALPELPVFLRADRDSILQSDGDGKLRPVGWGSQVIGKYITDVVLPFELRNPGSYKKMIEAVRDAVAAAQEITGEWTAVISAGVYAAGKEWRMSPISDIRPVTVGVDGLTRLHLTLPEDLSDNLWFFVERLGEEFLTLHRGHQPLDGVPPQSEPDAADPFLFEGEPVVIGDHQWRCVVKSGHAPVAEYQFRKVGCQDDWHCDQEWPSWDVGDLFHNGLPPSLSDKAYYPYQEQIKAALLDKAAPQPSVA